MRRLYLAIIGIVVFIVGMVVGAIFLHNYYDRGFADELAFSTSVIINQHVMLLKQLNAQEYAEAEGFLKDAIASDIRDAKTLLDMSLSEASRSELLSRIDLATEALAYPSKSLSELFWGDGEKNTSNYTAERNG